MSDDRKVVRALMNGLITGSYGGLDAAAEIINVSYAVGTNKGTLSKKAAGHLDFTIADMMALENAVTSFPVTKWLNRRRFSIAASDQAGSLVQLTGNSSKEFGEAFQAILNLSQSLGGKAEAIKELRDAKASLEEIERHIEAMA